MFKFLNSNVTDESLMLKYQQGDSSAFEKLYHRHKDPLFAFLYRSHVDLQAIEEIAQETWMAVINTAERYRPTAKFKTYLFAIAHRKLVDFWRKHKIEYLVGRVDEKDENIVEKVPGPAKLNASSIDLSMDLLLALETLSKEQQQAFLLREEGFTRREIAVMTGSNEETIKSRIRYATAHLKRILEVQYAD
ncbi:MAG: sigma-70 family RNA polymerase sigma factor [Gammaproteobacteria bacterium]|jgi:RNA polymerase sigma-70 factor (ECF subfamily)|nr:sigma-70 family RNA polymerase sigma factor [Gammaproteobacteria bacterium]